MMHMNKTGGLFFCAAQLDRRDEFAPSELLSKSKRTGFCRYAFYLERQCITIGNNGTKTQRPATGKAMVIPNAFLHTSQAEYEFLRVAHQLDVLSTLCSKEREANALSFYKQNEKQQEHDEVVNTFKDKFDALAALQKRQLKTQN